MVENKLHALLLNRAVKVLSSCNSGYKVRYIKRSPCRSRHLTSPHNIYLLNHGYQYAVPYVNVPKEKSSSTNKSGVIIQNVLDQQRHRYSYESNNALQCKPPPLIGIWQTLAGRL